MIWSEPLRTTYREYQIRAIGFPSFGGLSAIEGLNLLEAADLFGHGHYTASPEALYWFIQISRVAGLVGFPGSGSGVPPQILKK